MEHVDYFSPEQAEGYSDPAAVIGWYIVLRDADGEVYDTIGPYESESAAVHMLGEGIAVGNVYPDATSCTGCA